MDLASAKAEIRHVFGDTPITEASIGAAPPDILVKLSACDMLYFETCNFTLNIFQAFVFTYFKQEQQCLWNYGR